MNKLQLKEKEIKFTSSLPTEVTGLTQIKGEIENATEAKQLLAPLKSYADSKERLTIAKKAVKTEVNAILAEAKEVETAFSLLETEIKDKALALVKTSVETKYKRTGEVVTKEIHNLPFGFSFTPAKITRVINEEKIKKDVHDNQEASPYRSFVTKVITTSYEIDKAALEAYIAAGNKVPMMKQETEAKISIQQKALVDPLRQNDIAALLEDK